MKHDLLIGIPLAFFVLYPLVMRWLARAVQPARLQLAKSGAVLIESARLSFEQKQLVVSMLKDAYDFRVGALMVIMMPLFVLAVVRGSVRLGDTHAQMATEIEEFKSFSTCHMISVAAANPLCFVLFLVELTVFAPLLAIAVLFKRQYSNATASEFMMFANASVDRKLRYLAA